MIRKRERMQKLGNTGQLLEGLLIEDTGAHIVPRPNSVLLDLNLPRMDGRAVLTLIKDDKDLKTIPIVVLRTSEAEADIVKSYQLKAQLLLEQARGAAGVI
jgi:CheY-like chemotaxis protein